LQQFRNGIVDIVPHGAVEWKSRSSRRSGEVTDRDSYREMEDIIDAGWAGLIVVED
jgi:hypothetical protein